MFINYNAFLVPLNSKPYSIGRLTDAGANLRENINGEDLRDSTHQFQEKTFYIEHYNSERTYYSEQQNDLQENDRHVFIN